MDQTAQVGDAEFDNLAFYSLKEMDIQVEDEEEELFESCDIEEFEEESSEFGDQIS